MIERLLVPIDGGALDAQQGRDLPVALALLEQELEDGALIRRELVKAGHAGREATGAVPIGCRSPWICRTRSTRDSTACTAS